jgi:hypothetical protein
MCWQYVEVAIVEELFKLHFTQKKGSLFRGVPLMVNVEHCLYVEKKRCSIFTGNLLDEIVMQIVIIFILLFFIYFYFLWRMWCYLYMY